MIRINVLYDNLMCGKNKKMSNKHSSSNISNIFNSKLTLDQEHSSSDTSHEFVKTQTTQMTTNNDSGWTSRIETKNHFGHPILEHAKYQKTLAKTTSWNPIDLSTGDKTYVNLKEDLLECMKCLLFTNNKENPHPHMISPSLGYSVARNAVADYLNRSNNKRNNNVNFTCGDVIITPGCTASVNICLQVLTSPGKSVLIPSPGYPLYESLCKSLHLNPKHYKLLEKDHWNVDLQHFESLINSDTAAIILNNPSNPCGTIHNDEHLKQIGAIAKKHRIPIIADEIYAYMDYPEALQQCLSIAAAVPDVPIFVCGGISKKFALPGWRIGWVAVHDKLKLVEPIRNSFEALMTLFPGTNTLVQCALPKLLAEPSNSFVNAYLCFIMCMAKTAFRRLQVCKGLTPQLPETGLYMIVKVDLSKFRSFKTIQDFTDALIKEVAVYCLPGSLFKLDDYFRISLLVSEETMLDACQRIREFCDKHYTEQPGEMSTMSSSQPILQDQKATQTSEKKSPKKKVKTSSPSSDDEEEDSEGEDDDDDEEEEEDSPEESPKHKKKAKTKSGNNTTMTTTTQTSPSSLEATIQSSSASLSENT